MFPAELGLPAALMIPVWCTISKSFATHATRLTVRRSTSQRDLASPCAPPHRAVRSHSLMLSVPPDSAVRPSGANATERIRLDCPLKVRSSFPVPTSHSLSVPSQLPDSAVRPSGENATELTEPKCFQKLTTCLPVATSHSLGVWSPPPDSAVRPSGEKATELTDP